MKPVVICLTFFFFSHCLVAQVSFSYDLESPSKTIILPDYLKEISGLTIDETGQYLWVVQDERGTIFKIDIEAAAVIDSIKFWKDGDYEGIEMVDNKFYVLKSSGTIYEVSTKVEDNLIVQKFNDHLNKEDDTEGLGYSLDNQSLIIACKNGKKNEKPLYSFDLTTKKFSKAPFLRVNKKTILSFIKSQSALSDRKQLKKQFKEKGFKFAPSAIAVQAKTGLTFLLSSKGKVLLLLDKDYNIINLIKLNKATHPQPEGICLDAHGNLFISNEGKKGKAMIYQFEKKE